MYKNKWLPRVAIASAVIVYFLIIFGSHVRVTDSGMGCPDWPLCKGSLNPDQGFHAFMEQTHRYIAALATIFVTLTALLAYRTKSHSSLLRPAIFTGLIVIIQIVLGAVTVYYGNRAPSVAAHLLAGLSLLGAATVTAVASVLPRVETQGRRLKPVGWIAIVGAGLLYISGSLIVNADAEKYCAKIPLCPTGVPDRYVALHLIHRSMVVIVTVALLSFSFHAWKHWSNYPGARPLALVIVLLIIATATLGIISALHKAPPHIADLHLAGAAAVLAATSALATLGWLTAADVPSHKQAMIPSTTRLVS